MIRSLAAALLMLGAAQATAEPRAAPDVLSGVNADRFAQGLPRLSTDARLTAAAARHAAEMAATGRLAHDGASGGPGDRVVAAGCRWCRVSENVAFGARSAPEVVALWLASPGHRANIRDPDVTQGAAAMAEGHGRAWWVLVFARPC